MSTSETTEPATREGTAHREYILGVRIVEAETEAGTRYRFEAPHHRGQTFESARIAELYADVYFDVNGFQEEGTGERGVPPEIIQAGRDTLAVYMLTQPFADTNWVASFYGVKPERIERYVSWVRGRAEEVRSGAAEMGME